MNQLINLFKLLSDESRLRIIMMLYHQELCVCQLTGILELSQPTISKNLSKLRDLNLVKDTRKEKFVLKNIFLSISSWIRFMFSYARTPCPILEAPNLIESTILSYPLASPA